MDLTKPYTFDRIVRISFGAALIGALVWLLDYLSDVLVPFAVAFLAAYLLNPLVVWVQKKVPSRPLAVFISLGAVIVIFVGLLMLVVPLVSSEIARAGRLFSDLLSNSELARQAAQKLPPDLYEAFRELLQQERVREFLYSSDAVSLAKTVTQKALPGVWGLVTGTASLISGLFGLSVVVLYIVFLLFDYQVIKQGWKDLLPAPYRQPVLEFIESFNKAMSRYFRAQALVALIVGVLFAIGFSLIGLPLGILLGLFIGLLNMVPYLQIIGLIPAIGFGAIHALDTGSSIWWQLGLVGVVFGVVQLIQDALLVPRIMGKVMGLRPAIILLSLSIWGKLLGLLGLLIALPMTCLLLAYYQRLLNTQTETGQTPEPQP